MSEQFLSSGDVARMAQVSNQCVWQWVNEGRLRVAVQSRRGIARLFRLSDVQKLLAERERRKKVRGARKAG